MVAPYRPLIPGDWVRVEQLINEIFAILNQDTTLSDMVSDITLIGSDLKLVSDALSEALSDIAVLKAASGGAAGNNTEVQYNVSGKLGTSPKLTFNEAASTLQIAGTTKTKRLLAGGVSP